MADFRESYPQSDNRPELSVVGSSATDKTRETKSVPEPEQSQEPPKLTGFIPTIERKVIPNTHFFGGREPTVKEVAANYAAPDPRVAQLPVHLNRRAKPFTSF